MQVFEFILYCILFIFILRIIFRIIFPLVLRKYFHHLQNKFSIFGNTQEEDNSRHEGDVKIDYMPEQKKPKHTSDSGEYVDYEEIQK
jgi:hypothetical protein